MNTQTANSNNEIVNGNNGGTELDGATIKFWQREMRIDRILAGSGRKTRSSRRSTTPVVSSQAFVPSIPEGVNPDDVIPGTGWTWADALDESLSRTRH